MEIWIEKELVNILDSCILGLIFGGIYDIIRIIHILCGIVSDEARGCLARMKCGKYAFAVFFLCDVVFILCAALVFSVFLFAASSGIFRWYLGIGVLAGFLLWRATVGQLVVFCAGAFVRLLRRAIRVLIVQPIRALLRVLWRLIRWTVRHTFGLLLDRIRYLYGICYTAAVERRLEREFSFVSTTRKGGGR